MDKKNTYPRERYPASGARMRKVRKHFGGTNRRMAIALGISDAYASELCKGFKQPGAALCVKIQRETKAKFLQSTLRPDLF